MGEVTDYYKPIPGKTFCEMLQSKTFHLWSNDGEHWVQPNYGIYDDLGGGDSVSDERDYLSFWGTFHPEEYRFRAGCCDMAYDGGNDGWGQPFEFYYTIKPEGIHFV